MQPPDGSAATRFAAVAALVEALEQGFEAPQLAPSPLEDLSLRHLAKATGTSRSALTLVAQARWIDACILARALFEQLFAYLWVVQDPAKAEVRAVMVTLKQEWANAKYLEGLAARAPEAARPELLAEAAGYRVEAEAMLARLAAELGTTEKKVRDEATLRVSAKALEVNLEPAFSVPYAYYSGFVHTDGNALAVYRVGSHYDPRGALPSNVPLAGDLHRVLLRMATEVAARVPNAPGAAVLATHAAWLATADALEPLQGAPTLYGPRAR